VVRRLQSVIARGLKTFAAAAIALACGAGAAFAQDGDWRRAESPHFVIYSNGGERQLREAARTLEAYDAVLRALLQPSGQPSPNKLEVYLLRGTTNLRAVWPGVSEMVRGFYIAAPDLIAAFALYTNEGGLDAQEVLFHEYAHHFMLQNTSEAYPAWYVEGFAEFVQTVEFDDDRAIVGNYSEARAADILHRWVSIEEFLDSGNAHLNGLQMLQFYAESWVATHYLMKTPERMEGMTAYLRALEHGANPVDAFEPSFGITPAQFEAELRTYSRGGISRFAMPEPEIDVAAIMVTRLSEAADDLLLPIARMRKGVPASEQEALIARVERIAARFPADPFAQRAAARAALLRNAPAEARAILAPVIAANASDVEALYLTGLTSVIEASAAPPEARTDLARAARRAFARAFRVDPNHVPTLYWYASTYALAGEPMPDTATEALLQAYVLAPQVDEIAFTAATVLMQEGEYDQAETMLRPVAFSPHRGAGAAQAQQLLQLIEQMESAAGVGAVAPASN
jgi:tetratricopeptide (TPR) repeat protein